MWWRVVLVYHQPLVARVHFNGEIHLATELFIVPYQVRQHRERDLFL